MPAGGASTGGGGGGGGGAGAGGTRARESKPRGVSKGAAKYKEEQANKAPSGRAQKVIDKKAATKARKTENLDGKAVAKAEYFVNKAVAKVKKFKGDGDFPSDGDRDYK